MGIVVENGTAPGDENIVSNFDLCGAGNKRVPNGSISSYDDGSPCAFRDKTPFHDTAVAHFKAASCAIPNRPEVNLGRGVYFNFWMSQ
jgi:hypothetical protein